MTFQTLPLVLFVVFLETAAGGFLTLLMTDFGGGVGRGFLATSAVVLLMCGFVARLGGQAMPRALPAQGFAGNPEWAAAAQTLCSLFLALGLAYFVLLLVRAPRLRRAVGTAACAAAGASLVATAVGYHGAVSGVLVALLSLVAGTLALGGALGGLLLGHWYLVSPKMPTRPLQRMNWLLIAGLALEIAVLALSLALFQPQAALSAAQQVPLSYSAILWLRAGIGIVFPLVLALMVLQCCRLRSLQSATGLLYLAVAAVWGTEVAARVLYFITAAPV